MVLPIEMFQIRSINEIRDEYGGIVQTLDDRIHVASVAQILQTR